MGAKITKHEQLVYVLHYNIAPAPPRLSQNSGAKREWHMALLRQAHHLRRKPHPLLSLGHMVVAWHVHLPGCSMPRAQDQHALPAHDKPQLRWSLLCCPQPHLVLPNRCLSTHAVGARLLTWGTMPMALRRLPSVASRTFRPLSRMLPCARELQAACAVEREEAQLGSACARSISLVGLPQERP